MNEAPNRNDTLDSLRGLAILLVICVHVPERFTQLELGFLERLAVTFGASGVQLFFIVSAYTMMLTFGEHRNFGAGVIAFWVRRWFRIAPMFYLAGLLYLGMYGMSPRFWAPEGLSVSDVLLTFSFLHWMSPTAFNSLIPGGWSIAVEMQFYAIFPFVWLAFKSLEEDQQWWPYLVLLGLSVAALLIGKWVVVPELTAALKPNESHLASTFVFFWLPRQIVCFAVGLFVFQRLNGQRTDLRSLILLAATLLIYRQWGMVVASLGILTWFSLKRGISSRALSFIGQRSYSIYLVHFAVIDVLRSSVEALARVHSFVAVFLAVFAGSLLIAMVARRFIEEPFVAFARALTYRLAARQPATEGC